MSVYSPDVVPPQTLKELRRLAGKSRAQVAADLDLSERHLYRLEGGQTPLKRMHLIAFADYYGVEPDDIALATVAAA